MRIYTTAMTLGEDAFGRQALRSKLLHLLARDTLLRYFWFKKSERPVSMEGVLSLDVKT